MKQSRLRFSCYSYRNSLHKIQKYSTGRNSHSSRYILFQPHLIKTKIRHQTRCSHDLNTKTIPNSSATMLHLKPPSIRYIHRKVDGPHEHPQPVIISRATVKKLAANLDIPDFLPQSINYLADKHRWAISHSSSPQTAERSQISDDENNTISVFSLPVDFHKRMLDCYSVSVRSQGIQLRYLSPKTQVSTLAINWATIQACWTENRSYLITPQSDVFAGSNSQDDFIASKSQALERVHPDGSIFSLTEPLNDSHLQGSILYINKLKMQLTGQPDQLHTWDFSSKFVDAANVQPGDSILDLFFGLGYCTSECLQRGAKLVTGFEKYGPVSELVSLNPWSPSLTDSRIRYFPKTDLQHPHLVKQLVEGPHGAYNAIIVDPPKQQIMLKIYQSEKYLLTLHNLLASKGRFVFYVPSEQSLSPKFRNLAASLVDTPLFRSCYLPSQSSEQNILVFQKKD